MSALPISLLPVLSIIAVMERPCSCGHDKPTGRCAECGIEICAHCRHEGRADHCDGCGCELPKAEEPEAEYEECRAGCCGTGCLCCAGRGFVVAR